MYANTPDKYAFYSGRFDCYDIILKNREKFNKQKDKFFMENINSLVLTANKSENDDEFSKKRLKNDFENEINHFLTYEDLVNFYKKNYYKKAKKIINQFKEDKILLKKEEVYNLIEISCKNINI